MWIIEMLERNEVKWLDSVMFYVRLNIHVTYEEAVLRNINLIYAPSNEYVF